MQVVDRRLFETKQLSFGSFQHPALPPCATHSAYPCKRVSAFLLWRYRFASRAALQFEVNDEKICLAAFSTFAFASLGFAQDYPSRPVTFIVPYGAGGPVDTMARTLSEPMRASLGQPVVIENVTGANGTIGVGRAVHAAPDGYTVSIGNWPSHITNGAIYNLNYDIQKDLVPVARLPQNPYIAVVRKDFPAKDFKELIAWLKANPDKATEGTAGWAPASTSAASISRRSPAPGSSSCRTSPAPPTSFATSRPATSTSPSTRPSPRCRTSRAAMCGRYAVTSDKRLDAAPDIPTVDEAGAPGIYISTWYGLWVPKGTPQEAIDKLGEAARAAMADPAVRQRLLALGQQIPPPEQQTAAALAAYTKAEIDKWHPIIKDAGIKAE